MELSAIYIKLTHEILYSRATHDYRESSDTKCAIDGGLDYVRIIGDPSDFIEIKLDGDVLLTLILKNDYSFYNNNAINFPEGYHGRFKLTKLSNLDFFKNLILNYIDIQDEINSWYLREE